MSSKTKILVLKLKEIIYTLIFVVLGIILIVLLFLIFTGKSKKNHSAPPAAQTISLVNTSESVATMYPLISSSLSDIASQVVKNNSTDKVTYSSDSKYTSIVLIKAINDALEKAAP